jgi:hypothetical protein
MIIKKEPFAGVSSRITALGLFGVRKSYGRKIWVCFFAAIFAFRSVRQL